MKREHILRTNYHRSHPHFLRYMALDAVLSFALVFGGFQIAAAHSSARLDVAMEHAGLIAMSTSEFIDHLKDNDISAYWLGPMAGKKYTINHTEDDQHTITYWPFGVEAKHTNQPQLTVDTHKDFMAYAADVRPFVLLNSAELVTASGNTVQFNTESMKVVKVTIKETLKIVEIRYPTRQTEQILLQNAENLKLVW